MYLLSSFPATWHIMSSTTTTKTLEVLRQTFAAYGLPEQIVTDNGPQFISDEFANFTKANGIKHNIRTAPYHPASNGLAERFVQSLKQSLKTTSNSGHSLNYRVSNYLLSYRSTPHATTGVAPCTLFLKRNLHTRFDLLRPNCERHVMEKQGLQKDHKDQHCRDRSWYVGERVMVRNLRPGSDWIPGVVVEILGPVTYLVDVGRDQIWKRHTDQLKSIEEKPPSLTDNPTKSVLWMPPTLKKLYPIETHLNLTKWLFSCLGMTLLRLQRSNLNLLRNLHYLLPIQLRPRQCLPHLTLWNDENTQVVHARLQTGIMHINGINSETYLFNFCHYSLSDLYSHFSGEECSVLIIVISCHVAYVLILGASAPPFLYIYLCVCHVNYNCY